MKKQVHKQIGYAVLTLRGIEFWIYDPAVLTAKQRKLLGVRAWEKFTAKVTEQVRP